MSDLDRDWGVNVDEEYEHIAEDPIVEKCSCGGSIVVDIIDGQALLGCNSCSPQDEYLLLRGEKASELQYQGSPAW